VDGTVMVVRPGVVDLESARGAKEFLTRSHQNVLGMVANGVQVNNEPDSYFYFRQNQDALPAGSTASAKLLTPSAREKVNR
jgi:Mrp family chromosome partitioning ATPase